MASILCPHSWHNGLMAMANAHLVAALPNPRVLEVCMIQGPLQWGILGRIAHRLRTAISICRRGPV